MQVTDAGANHEVEVNAVAGDFVASHAEDNGLLRTLAQHGDLDDRPLGPLEQFSNVAGAHVVGRLAVHGDDHVARPDAGAVGRTAHKGSDDNHFIVARAHLHAYAVIFAALLLAQSGVGLGIKEIGVRIEHPQHAGNGAVVNCLIWIERLGVVLLHYLVHLREVAQAVVHVGNAG